MYAQYGSYQHQIGEGSLTVSRETEYQSGIATAVRLRYRMQGRIQIADQGSLLANQSLMTAALNALETAYEINGLDFALYQDDGTPTVHGIESAATIGGTRVVTPVTYPIGRGAEYSTFRNYEVAVEALLPNVLVGLVSWSETLNFIGGGPAYAFLQTLTGPAVKQQLCEQTTYKATQSGMAIGAYSYPLPSDPLWPYALHPDRARITQVSPRRVGATGLIQFQNFQTHWSYEFEDTAPLVGQPNLWGNG